MKSVKTSCFSPEDALKKADSCRGIFDGFPERTPIRTVPDGPLFGNGDLGAVAGCDERALRFYISKNDLWHAAFEQFGGGVKSLGFLEIRPENPVNLSFQAEQRIAHAEIITDLAFQDDGNKEQHLRIRSYAPRHENLIITEIECLKGNPLITADLVPMPDPSADFSHRTAGNRIFISKSYRGPDTLWETHVYAGLFIPGRDSAHFRIREGEKLLLAVCIATNHDTPEYVRCVEDTLCPDLPGKLPRYRQEHIQWWDSFWKTSGVSLPSLPEIEHFWYGSHYILACCSQEGKFAPGIFGNWVTTDSPCWSGDYHLNYNYQAPWWGAFSSNKVSLTDSYDPPLMEYMEKARKNASEQLGCHGLYAKVGIGPKGLETSTGVRPDGSLCESSAYWGQKSNAAYAALNMAMRFYYTYDREYARKYAYPFLLETAAFWEDYLKFEDGRYVICNDCIQENPAAGLGVYGWVGENPPDYSSDLNPLLTLGLLRVLFRALLDITEYMDADRPENARVEKWRHILEHLSDFPTQIREGKTVFRYTEKGMDWCDGNSLGIQHIFPCGAVGLSSDPRLLNTARDTLELMARWEDPNAFPTFYTAAVRIGYDPEVILAHMRTALERHAFPNFFIFFGGGGIECCSTVPGCINEMLFQSFEGVLRFFPVWDRRRDAEFYNLRGYGAFLVSAKLEHGIIHPIRLYSERGLPCKVLCPWEDGMKVYRITRGQAGKAAEENTKEVTEENTEGVTEKIAEEIHCREEKTGAGLICSFATEPDTFYELREA